MERSAELSITIPAASEVTPGSADLKVPAGGRREIAINVTIPATVSVGFTHATLNCRLGSIHITRELRLGVHAAQPDAGPVALWHLDEGQGTVAHDASQHRNDGVIDHAEWVPGRTGTALRFDGAGSVTIPDSPSLNLTDEVTVAFLLRVDGDTGTWQTPLCKDLADQCRNYSIYLMPGTFIPCFSGSFEKGTYRHLDVASGVSLKPGQWYHIAATYSMFDRRLRLYVDGKIAVDQGQDLGQMLITSEPVRLGQGLKGTLAEVSIYPRALTAAEIAALARK
jgi:hypothetical protein